MQPLDPHLDAISKLVVTLDLDQTDAAEAALAAAFPPEGEVVQTMEREALAALEAGTLCDRGEPPVRFNRVRKPPADPAGCSIDAVFMDDAKGPAHTHDRGEVCLCFPLPSTGDAPTFEGRRATWMVLPPGSRHEPEVRGGRMLILYWWPEGAVTWG